jgi:hypothetical protein
VPAVFNLLITLLPLLKEYFTKNKGLNTVTGGFMGAFGVLLIQAIQGGEYDQFVAWLQSQGETGLLVGAVVAALRTLVLVYAASKAKK